MTEIMRNDTRIGFPRFWTIAGYLLLALGALFVGRIVYEETILTWTNGPQMVGFAVFHGAVPFVLPAGLIGLPGSVLWMLVSIALLFRRHFRVRLVDWLPMVILPFLALMLFIPYEIWEELMVRTVGPGSYGSYFLVQAAAQDKRRFVALLLRKGYDVNHELAGGETPLSAASNGGHQEMVRFLISKGADVNRKDHLVGESPVMGAAEMGQLGTVKVLLSNGADPCATDKEGHTAEGLAKKYHHDDIADYLSSRFHCKEKLAPPCVESAFTACVH